MSSKNLLILLVIVIWVFEPAKRQFPREKEFEISEKIIAKGREMVTKKKYEEEKRCGANGSGKDRLRVVYQNGGNYKYSFEIISQIETIMQNTRPHVLFMSENRMDTGTRERLENRHGFTVETLGENERIWAAIRTTVPYKRRRDCEEKGVCALWLEFGTGSQKFVFIGAYREFCRLGGGKTSRVVEMQKKRWSRLMTRIRDFIVANKGTEVHLVGDLNLDKKRWPQLGSLKKSWKYSWFTEEMYRTIINGAGMILSDIPGTTWTSKDGSRSSCLDLHFCNKPEKTKSVKISHELEGADHDTMIVERSDKDVAGDFGCTKRKWGQVDYVWCVESYATFLAHKVNTELLRIQDPEEVANRLTCILNVHLDWKWPVTSFKVKP